MYSQRVELNYEYDAIKKFFFGRSNEKDIFVIAGIFKNEIEDDGFINPFSKMMMKEDQEESDKIEEVQIEMRHRFEKLERNASQDRDEIMASINEMQSVMR